jgi:hypothetical protein
VVLLNALEEVCDHSSLNRLDLLFEHGPERMHALLKYLRPKVLLLELVSDFLEQHLELFSDHGGIVLIYLPLNHIQDLKDLALVADTDRWQSLLQKLDD